MQFIVQDNNGLPNADSYVSVDELNNYATKRGIVLTSDDVETLLVRAMDYLSTKSFKGEPMNSAQSTHFPVKGLGVPDAIKRAQMMLAIQSDSQPLLAPVTNGVKREKVDVVEVEYFEASDNGMINFPAIDALLAPYLDNGGGFSGWNIRVQRG